MAQVTSPQRSHASQLNRELNVLLFKLHEAGFHHQHNGIGDLIDELESLMLTIVEIGSGEIVVDAKNWNEVLDELDEMLSILRSYLKMRMNSADKPLKPKGVQVLYDLAKLDIRSFRLGNVYQLNPNVLMLIGSFIL